MHERDKQRPLNNDIHNVIHVEAEYVLYYNNKLLI